MDCMPSFGKGVKMESRTGLGWRSENVAQSNFCLIMVQQYHFGDVVPSTFLCPSLFSAIFERYTVENCAKTMKVCHQTALLNDLWIFVSLYFTKLNWFMKQEIINTCKYSDFKIKFKIIFVRHGIKKYCLRQLSLI